MEANRTMELNPGYIKHLLVKEKEGSRWVLEGKEGDIMMNVSDAAESVQGGDHVEVFLYNNRRNELTATMQLPNMTCDTYGWAKVIRVDNKLGVYVDIGSSIEVLVNGADLPHIRSLWPEVGDEIYMTLRTDLGGEIFGRLITEERVMERFTIAESSLFNKNLQARPYRLLPVGSFLLSIPDSYRIFVHHSEQLNEPRFGEEVEVRIIGVREDGTLNGSMLPRVEERLTGDAETIYEYLVEIGGKMPFTDKSSPDEIYEMFKMSKGAFKRALGRLMKERKIVQEDGWTKLV